MDLKQIRLVGRGRIWALVAAVAVSAGTFLVQARSPAPLSEPGTASVALSQLPAQGQQVMAQIHSGGPFRYEKDGAVFGNRERLLPSQKRGYYRAYTVPTLGLSNRGPRRIVCGGLQPRQPDACFYTEDHYSSFRLIVQ